MDPSASSKPSEWAANALNRVNRNEFFRRFQQEQAVQYFYEPFLEAYDPILRKALGVWYTPPEIVKYQVARVDTVLREELNLPDGLADLNVIVLDPCCGTGAYIVEVLRKIHEVEVDTNNDALVAYYVKLAAMSRVIGFECISGFVETAGAAESTNSSRKSALPFKTRIPNAPRSTPPSRPRRIPGPNIWRSSWMQSSTKINAPTNSTCPVNTSASS